MNKLIVTVSGVANSGKSQLASCLHANLKVCLPDCNVVLTPDDDEEGKTPSFNFPHVLNMWVKEIVINTAQIPRVPPTNPDTDRILTKIQILERVARYFETRTQTRLTPNEFYELLGHTRQEAYAALSTRP